MKKLIVFFSLFVSLSFLGQSPSINDVHEIVSVLASDSLKGRPSSSIYEDKAGAYIIKKLEQIKGCKPKKQFFTFKRAPQAEEQKATNIYWHINNKADSTIVISAHYDHLGTGEGLSRSFGKTGIHFGADDNASGVALTLSLAQKKVNYSSKKFNYLFVFYSAHEIGLFGSQAFADFCSKKFKPVALVINFDMVGRLDSEVKILNVYGITTLKRRDDFFKTVSFPGKIYTGESYKIDESDCKWFSQRKNKCLSFSTGMHDDYHKITDTADKINFEGILMIENYIIDLLNSFAKS